MNKSLSSAALLKFILFSDVTELPTIASNLQSSASAFIGFGITDVHHRDELNYFLKHNFELPCILV